MITPLEVYGILMLDNAFILSIIIFCALGLIGCALMSHDCDHTPRCESSCKDGFTGFKLFCAAIIFLIISLFIPSSKQMAAILIIPKIVNSQTTQKAVNEVPDKLMKIFGKWADDELGVDKE